LVWKQRAARIIFLLHLKLNSSLIFDKHCFSILNHNLLLVF
jgi:hypothetical protein